jgi:hypothetical protein
MFAALCGMCGAFLLHGTITTGRPYFYGDELFL